LKRCINPKKPLCVSGIQERPEAINVSMPLLRFERKSSTKLGAYFEQSRKPPEVKDSKINTGTFLPAEWGESGEIKFRFRILRRTPGFNMVPETAREREKQIKYAKIKGCANGIKGSIKRRQIAIVLFLAASTFLSTKR
jgi:hypothetical protein